MVYYFYFQLDSCNSDNIAPGLQSTSLFYTVLNDRIKVPLKWFIDIDISDNHSTTTTTIKKAISFQKLSSFSKNYVKFIEKQLVLIEGKIIYILQTF